jgi:hypothetical protein
VISDQRRGRGRGLNRQDAKEEKFLVIWGVVGVYRGAMGKREEVSSEQ